ncbi:MAG TPA: OmpH family outer membrane protein [Pirellulaceae bacterium]|nr:OmpH family outer membrane protein [Pirellulaceae bacterium]HMO91544.1 OmpH family outer membrane protein [Pirellulaceae bacterium]HMP68241.1 OmpH family outer membrane protein [Pirellulaceae bacterium]
MKSFFVLTGFLLACLAGNSAYAQANNVCVIDVATVFKNNDAFNTKLEALKKETEQFAQYLQNRVTELQTMQEQLRTMNVNSPDFAALERKLAQDNANLQIERNEKTRKIQQREAQIHFETYVQTTQAVAMVCNQKNIRLVLQYANHEMDLDNPESIMMKVNSDVVFHKPHKDITREVIAILNSPNFNDRSSAVPQTNR